MVFDAVGKTSYRRCRRSLDTARIFVETDLGFMWHIPLLICGPGWCVVGRCHTADPDVHPRRGRIRRSAAHERRTRPRRRSDLLAVEEVVAATKYVETGEKIGNVVLTVEPAAVS